MIRKSKMHRFIQTLILVLLSVVLIACDSDNESIDLHNSIEETYKDSSFSLSEIEEFANNPYSIVNDNIPYFNEEDYTTQAFEKYSELDYLGRCGVAYANICIEIMPTKERGEIGMIKPSGWHTVKYDIVDGKYLYNRCHLIGYQLSGENDNVNNLITGTRYMNVEGMLPFENMVDSYVENTNNHVLYRVTPMFEGENLLATGVLMEAWSVEDNGEGICFNVFVYNSQPGIIIDYSNGESKIDENYNQNEETTKLIDTAEEYYVINTNTKKFHKKDCESAKKINEGNKIIYYGSREEVIKQGFAPCGNCKP